MAVPTRNDSPSGPATSTADTPPTRRQWLRWSAGGGVAATAGAAGASLWHAHSGQHRQLTYGTLAQAMTEVERLGAAPVRPLDPATAWNWQQTLTHCAQSIEYSLQGFPNSRSALFQAAVGGPAFQVFAWRGRMSHDLAEPIPGAPALDASAPDASVALARLQAAAQAFLAHGGALQPHFAYGALSKGQYELAHAMHLANHLSAFDLA